MSRGQLSRNTLRFPRMNDRAGRRRYRRALARAHRLVAEAADKPYSYGGWIPPAASVRVALATDECVLARRHDGEWACYRTDPEHTATSAHREFAQLFTLTADSPLAALVAELAHHDQR